MMIAAHDFEMNPQFEGRYILVYEGGVVAKIDTKGAENAKKFQKEFESRNAITTKLFVEVGSKP